MIFNSPEFFVFFLVTACGFFALGRLRQRLAIGWLVLCSLFFYGWRNPSYVFLIGGSIFFNYAIGSLLYRYRNRAILAVGVSANLLCLGYFKYYDFLMSSTASISGLDFNLAHIILPLGISFYTIQQITYLVDVYRNGSYERNIFDYALFVSFFPKLIAGPIVYQSDLLPQFKDDVTFKLERSAVYTGLTIFFLGLFKKVVVADGLSPYVQAVFDHADAGGSLTFFDAWGGALAYTLQLYYDFSGYSDMAIGLGYVLNIKLPINFNSPYQQSSIIDFWRCWHITLSRFLRDYIYIPLGGSRKGGSFRRFGNLMITMLLCGLWHGAARNFVFWGGLHGLYLLINHGWRKLLPSSPTQCRVMGLMKKQIYWLTTFSAVCFAWVFFRAVTFEGALRIVKGMLGLNGFVLPEQVLRVIPFLYDSGLIRGEGTMQLLGGGTILGLVEQVVMIGLFLCVALFSKNLYEINNRRRLLLLSLTAAFAIQKVFFNPVLSDFIYFQF